MKVQQFNASHVRKEDRVLLRVVMDTGDELRFWLTRACLKEFMGQIEAWLAPSDGSPDAILKSFQREAAVNKGDFSTPLKAGENFPLGEAPVLVESMRVETEGSAVRLLLQLVNRHVATFNLNEDVLVSVHYVLRKAMLAADWGLVAAETAAAPIHLH